MDKNIKTPLMSFETFKLNEETLEPVKQMPMLKSFLRTFDLQDLKFYLLGHMIDFDISTRKRLLMWFDQEKYRTVVMFLMKRTEDPIATLKLRSLLKIIMREVKAQPDEEIMTELPSEEI